MAQSGDMDLVIIGAGFNGLVMAKTYLDVNPSARLVILESDKTIGGVWCQGRLYAHLKTNNLLGALEYSDFPMDTPTFGVKEGEPIPGPIVHEYLKAYAKHFDISRRIRFNSRVDTVTERDNGGWEVGFTEGVGEKTSSKTISSKRLVVATGLTSEPYVPHIPGDDDFGAPIVHPRYLAEHGSLIHDCKEVIIVGGSKSGWDSAYAFADAGVKVNWIIRESGHGPTWMAPPYVTPLRKRLEKLVSVRFLSWFSPCIWGEHDGFGWVRRLLHNTTIGRFLVDTFWKILANDVITLNGYDKHPETKKLKPWTPPFWVASSLSILNYPTNFFDHVRNGNIKVHIADVDRLSHKTVHLSTGESICGDAIICSTGWKPCSTIKFRPEGIDKRLGMPQTRPKPSPAETARELKADATILERLPRLQNQPVRSSDRRALTDLRALDAQDHPALAKGEEEEPYRLYNFMVPPAFINERTIGFAGALMTVHTVMVAEAQALWLTAYFGQGLASDRQQRQQQQSGLANGHTKPEFDIDAVTNKTVLHSRYCKWRYPIGYGLRFPDFVFDVVPYMDMLLQDLGLVSRRKKSRWAELFHPYGPQDYQGMVDEWRVKVS
ncbi:hypothetical protein ACLMJK_006354 [Lecanora helva]